MLILIEKDSATKVPREVRDISEAQVFADQGYPVYVVNADNTNTPLADFVAALESEEVAPAGLPSDGLTVAELKEALEKKGVKVPTDAKKADLAALFDAA